MMEYHLRPCSHIEYDRPVSKIIQQETSLVVLFNQVELHVDRALARHRQYKRSAERDPMLLGDLGQLAGCCAMDLVTGEQFDGVEITVDNIFYDLGEAVDVYKLMQKMGAEAFEGLAAAQNSTILRLRWTNQEVLDLAARNVLHLEGQEKLRANIRVRSLNPKVKVGGNSRREAARILYEIVDPKQDGSGDGGVVRAYTHPAHTEHSRPPPSPRPLS
eukprot:COSAG01_NODE_6317_length_3739_cov_2.900549_2_plen_217_part_00